MAVNTQLLMELLRRRGVSGNEGDVRAALL